jgi:hypothetical protein
VRLKVRIEIRDDGQLGAQTHAYAEYRVFAALAPLGNVVQHVMITLALADVSGAHPVSGARLVCTVSVTTGPGQRAEVRAKGWHPYEAIDRAAARVRKVLLLRPYQRLCPWCEVVAYTIPTAWPDGSCARRRRGQHAIAKQPGSGPELRPATIHM